MEIAGWQHFVCFTSEEQWIFWSRQIVERLADIRMIGAQGFFSNRQRPLVERLSLAIATLVNVSLSVRVALPVQRRCSRCLKKTAWASLLPWSLSY
jgi:hypothetical protein